MLTVLSFLPLTFSEACPLRIRVMMTRSKGARSMVTKIEDGAQSRSCQMWDDGGPGCGMAVFGPAV
jgi:hypothetical protein